VYSDEILLDRRAPTISSVRVIDRSPLRLRVRAGDNLSKVRSIEVSSRKSARGHWLPFRHTVTVHGSPRRIFVRVRDGAGNLSAWRSAQP
jgi:hypothetical protein